MAKKSVALNEIVRAATAVALHGRSSEGGLSRIASSVWQEYVPGVRLGEARREQQPPPGADTDAWRLLLANLPLDEGSFRSLYGCERRDFSHKLGDWCEKLLNSTAAGPLSRITPTELRTFGHLGVLLLTMLTLEDADDRRLDDLADRGLSEKKPEFDDAVDQLGPAGVYAHTCERLIATSMVRTAIQDLYRPVLNASDQSALTGDPVDGPAMPYAAVETQAEANNKRTALAVWEDIDPASLSFHRFGTTSFILRGTARRTGSDLAVKLVLLPYAELAAIAQASRRYLVEFGEKTRGADFAPNVWASIDNFIVMDFVAGETLTEYVRRRYTRTKSTDRQSGILNGDKISDHETTGRFAHHQALAVLGPMLFTALNGLRERRLVHNDLNPSNIIVSTRNHGADEGVETLTFIDFGANYLYNNAGVRRHGSDAAYVAPEVRAPEMRSVGDEQVDDGPTSDDPLAYAADIYSLGQLLIAISDVGRAGDSTVPDAFYRRTPLLARFLEDLIEHDPRQRLLLLPQGMSSSAQLAALERSFTISLAAVAKADRQDGLFGPPSAWRRNVVLLTPVAGGPLRQWRLARSLNDQVARGRHLFVDPSWRRWLLATRRLTAWSVLSGAMWYGCIVLLSYLLARDVGLIPETAFDRFLSGLRARSYVVTGEDVQDNLPARIAGLSFAFAAVTYYQHVYSGLTAYIADGLDGPLRRRAVISEFFIRSNAVFVALIFVPINLVNPNWWTIGSAICLFDSLLVNWTGIAFAQQVMQQARRHVTPDNHNVRVLSTVPHSIPGLDIFKVFTPSMASYVGIVVFFAFFIDNHVLKDKLAYAMVVGVVNVALAFIKCNYHAEPVRIGLTRAYLAAERLAVLAARPSVGEGAEVRDQTSGMKLSQQDFAR